MTVGCFYSRIELPDKSWDGMIGKIMRGEADIAITDLTVTLERIKAIDFSPSILELGKKTRFVNFIEIILKLIYR